MKKLTIYFAIAITLLLFIPSNVFAIYIDTQIPSTSAGSTGLYTRIHIPDTMRYTSGAPIVIWLSGGNSSGGVLPRSEFLRFGFIAIQFSFPGGLNSGGIYDNRGPNCILALRDIIKFATGQITNTNGQTLQQLVYPKIPLYSNVGLIGSSHGGNISIAVAGVYGSEIQLAWICNWESPVGDGMPGAEAGARNPTNGNPWTNPAYNDTTGIFDYSKLKYSDTLRLTPTTFIGGFYFDINNNGVPNRGTDFVINGFGAAGKLYTSTTLIQESVNRGVFPAVPPSHIASLSQTQEFWRWRNGDLWIDSARNKLPNLMFIVIATDSDHVQSAKDHQHVYIQYEHFRSAGARFVRLNADRAYVEYCLGYSQPLARDNDAFTQYTRLTIRDKFEPEIIPDTINSAASVSELADRTCANNITANLNSVIYCNTVGVQNINYNIPDVSQLFQNYPNPFNPSTTIRFSLLQRGHVTLKVFDVLGREVANLMNGELNPGEHSVVFDAKSLPTGVYFYRLVVSGTNPLTSPIFSQTRAMELVR